MSILLYVNCCITFVFSCLLVVQNFSVLSLVATILGLAYSFALAFFTLELVRNKTQRGFRTTQKLLSYAIIVMMIVFLISRLTGKSHDVMDVILALLWFVLVIVVFITLRFFNGKRAEKYLGVTPEKQKRTFIGEVLSWGDALLWTIGHIFLLNIFILQLYEIPSESMVPTFMVKDRVVSLKLASGPKFPLTNFYLPRLTKYKRGNVVVLKSHRYPQTAENEWKNIWTQAVSMLTLMKVNLNTDPLTGRQKADPLVKRIVGMPGERLMLVDGVLYAKTSQDGDYHIVLQDAEYATWNLNALSSEEKKRVQNIVFPENIYDMILSIEEERKNVQFRTEYDEIERILHSATLQKNLNDNYSDVSSFLHQGEYSLTTLVFSNLDIARRIATTNGGLTWLREFSLSWADFWVSDKTDKASLYELRNAQLSVLIKKAFSKLILRNLQLFAQNSTETQIQDDPERQRLLEELDRYNIYVQLSNERNMNEFPKNGYLDTDEYFLMGDNRFNSLDMRHSSTTKEVALDEYDTMPVFYASRVFPEALPGKNILGLANFIFYPFDRAKAVK